MSERLNDERVPANFNEGEFLGMIEVANQARQNLTRLPSQVTPGIPQKVLNVRHDTAKQWGGVLLTFLAPTGLSTFDVQIRKAYEKIFTNEISYMNRKKWLILTFTFTKKIDGKDNFRFDVQVNLPPSKENVPPPEQPSAARTGTSMMSQRAKRPLNEISPEKFKKLTLQPVSITPANRSEECTPQRRTPPKKRVPIRPFRIVDEEADIFIENDDDGIFTQVPDSQMTELYEIYYIVIKNEPDSSDCVNLLSNQGVVRQAETIQDAAGENIQIEPRVHGDVSNVQIADEDSGSSNHALDTCSLQPKIMSRSHAEKNQYNRGSKKRKVSVDSSKKVYSCPHCSNTYQIKACYEWHLQMHRPLKFECLDCNRSFDKKRTFEYHTVNKVCANLKRHCTKPHSYRTQPNENDGTSLLSTSREAKTIDDTIEKSIRPIRKCRLRPPGRLGDEVSDMRNHELETRHLESSLRSSVGEQTNQFNCGTEIMVAPLETMKKACSQPRGSIAYEAKANHNCYVLIERLKTFECQCCNRSFHCKKSLEYHIKNKVCADSSPQSPMYHSFQFQQNENHEVAVVGASRAAKTIDDTIETFQCHYCNMSFFRKKSLKNHIVNRTCGKYKCPHFTEHYSSRKQFYEHINAQFGRDTFSNNRPTDNNKREIFSNNTNNNRRETFSINTDNKSEGYYNRHLLIRRPKTFQCHYCNMSFDRKKSLKHHVINKICGKFECPRCNLRYSERKKLNEHYEDHFLKKCAKCDQTFSSFDRFSEHMTAHTGKYLYYCPCCPKAYECRHNFNCHIDGHMGIKYHCEVCRKGFDRVNSMVRHLATHLGVRYQCPYCTRSYKTRIYLDGHILVHNKQSPFKCNKCNLQFATESERYNHNLIHSSKRTFACTECSKSYKQRRSLENHKKRKHSVICLSEKYFDCPICHKRLISSGKNTHMLRHSGEKPFCCDICPKRFSSKMSLQNHLWSHTGERSFNCKKCNKSFIHYNALCLHQLTHNDVRPYTCELCGKGFTQKIILLHHIRVHFGVKPYVCKQCPRRFTQKPALYAHVRKHLADKE